METVLRAPFRARLKECAVSVGSQVETGAPLLRLEPLADGAEDEDAASAASAELDLPAAPGEVPARDRVARGREGLRGLLLGFDVDPHDEGRVLEDYLAARRAAAADGHRPLAEEIGLLDVFADLAELSRNRPAGEDGDSGGHVHSAREYFHTYLQSLDVERAGLPKGFQAKLAKALGHYGVTDLERSPSWRRRSSGSSWRSSARPPTPRSSRRCCARGCGSRRRRRPSANRPGSRWSGSSPRRRGTSRWSTTSRPGWCSPGTPSRCCAATAPASTPASGRTCAT